MGSGKTFDAPGESQIANQGRIMARHPD